MKKLFLLLSIIFIPCCAFAANESSVLNLHSDKSYVITLDERPTDIQVSNPRITRADAVTDICSNDSYMVIQASEEGISYVTYKVGNQTKTIKLLIDDKADEDKDLWILDEIKEEK